ncbi:MAG: hypothetical protein IJU98_06360 [Synergistaceae bacterium]|nr:hypothetical protein [Synergistaceae bacterium]
MSKRRWKYLNSTDRTVIWRGERWGPGEEKEISYPVPASLGFTCLQEGNVPEPVLFHDDLILTPGETRTVELDGPQQTHNVALSLFCVKGGGAECRFTSRDNKPIPLDVRGFAHTLPWEMCARMVFTNTTETETHISVSAVEVTC